MVHAEPPDRDSCYDRCCHRFASSPLGVHLCLRSMHAWSTERVPGAVDTRGKNVPERRARRAIAQHILLCPTRPTSTASFAIESRGATSCWLGGLLRLEWQRSLKKRACARRHPSLSFVRFPILVFNSIWGLPIFWNYGPYCTAAAYSIQQPPITPVLFVAQFRSSCSFTR